MLFWSIWNVRFPWQRATTMRLDRSQRSEDFISIDSKNNKPHHAPKHVTYHRDLDVSSISAYLDTLPRHPLKQKERLVLLDFSWQRFAFAKTMSQLTASFLKKILNVQVGLFLVATENGPSVRRSVAQTVGPSLVTRRTRLLHTATIYKMWITQKC